MLLKIVETSEFEKTEISNKKVMSEELISFRHSEIISIFDSLQEGNTAIVCILNEDTTQNYISAFRRYWHLFQKESSNLRGYSFKTLSDKTIAISRLKQTDVEILGHKMEYLKDISNKIETQGIIICESAKGSGKSEYLKKVAERIASAPKLPEIWSEEEKLNRVKFNMGYIPLEYGTLKMPKETENRLLSGDWNLEKQTKIETAKREQIKTEIKI
jgi:hypothetical protein